MPKAPSSTVITYRIELQDTERRLLQNFVDAYTLEQVSTPIVEILKDASALYAVVTMIELFTDIDLPIITAADTEEIWNAIKEAVKTRRETYPDEPPAGSLAMIVVAQLVDFFGIGPNPLAGENGGTVVSSFGGRPPAAEEVVYQGVPEDDITSVW